MNKHPSFHHLDLAGLNGGVPPSLLAGRVVVPSSHLFTRSHAPPPIIAVADWRLTIDGLVATPLSLSLDEVRTRFPTREVTAALVCAGLRRSELLAVAPLGSELLWGGEPVANVRWGGVSLIDVLDAAGALAEVRHVRFTGFDRVERHGTVFGFGASIAIAKAREPAVLLATHLDGEPLSAEHGAPLRVVVPGWIGARSVKWLSRIELSREPSDNYFQTHAYRLLRQAEPGRPLDVAAGGPIEAIALNSMILTPTSGATCAAGTIAVHGWAIGPGAEAPHRVELAIDGGARWQEVELDSSGEPWSWRPWRATVELGPGTHRLVVRAWDQAGRTQPAHLHDVWNVKGYANNAWHRVEVVVEER